jgi:signal transduction histidine kinase
VRLISKDQLDDVQFTMLEARLNRIPWLRSIVISILVAVLMLTLIGDHAVWRRWILGLLGGCAVFQSIRTLMHPEHSHPARRIAGRHVWISSALGSGALFLATGGFDSPMLPMIIMLCFFTGTLSAARDLIAVTLAFGAVVCCMAIISMFGLVPSLMPVVFGGGARLPQPAFLLSAKMGALLLALAWAAIVSNAVRAVFRQIVSDAFDARDEVLRSHDAHGRELTALSGELAHELKNPLANMKGLAVLVSRDVQGKGVERLEVLRHEIGRMEEVLQSFLTFSRPLSPLSQQEVDLKDLCESVLALHEGMAQQKNVSLQLSAAAQVQSSCDSRKVKQILINLVQNALEASPPGATIELVLLPGPQAGAHVDVRDRGPGIAPDVSAHLFQPGATTKERGTGLGLALARALARQHDGELWLKNREGGGCIATLTLPARVALSTGEAA